MIRRSFQLITLTSAGILIACSGGDRRASSRDSTGTPSITIVYTAPHPVISEIIDGFKSEVLVAYPRVRFRERHAEGRTEQYSAVVLASIADAPDLLAPITTPISKLAVEESRGRVPVVFMGVTDPVGAGVAQSIDHPTIATGSSDLCPFDTLLATARQLLPRARVLGLPYNPADQPAVFGRQRLMQLASKYGFSIVDRQITSRDELPAEVAGLARRSDALIIAADNLMMENPDLIAASAENQGKPVLACDATSVEKGAVAGVSVRYRDVGQMAGKLAVRVLRGESAGSLPVAVLSSGGVILNKRAACAAHVPISDGMAAAAVRLVDSSFVCSKPR